MEMKYIGKISYPIILIPEDEGGYNIYIPDFDMNTQGENFDDALVMAADAIASTGLCYIEKGLELPEPYSSEFEIEYGDIKTAVDVDFDAYRNQSENR